MSRLQQIPIVVVHDESRPPIPAGPQVSAVLAVIHEIDAKVCTLLAEGREGTIDLKWLRAAPQDLELLRETLGRGEVAASVASFGESRVEETAVPCVWWVCHRDDDAQVLGEFIEIAEIPELLRSDRQAVPRRLAELRGRCAELESIHMLQPPPSPRTA
jgi:hydrogenase-1 operon protein HyaF